MERPIKISLKLLTRWVGSMVVLGCAVAQAGSDITKDLILSPGFKITIFQNDVAGARSLALGAKGTVFVGTKTTGQVHALRDGKHYIIAKNLNMPNGVFFHKGALYVAELSRIIKYEKIEENLEKPSEPVVVYGALPADKHHGWKFLAIGPDEKIYVPIGAPCNVCLRKDEPRFASILRMDLDGKNVEIYASGIRNTVGFDWHPVTGELWFTDNGRDWMGDDKPPCELNRAERMGLHFGFPFCHGGEYLDDEFGAGKKCKDYVPPVVKFQAHSAPLGIRFYNGNQFPAVYKNNIFIAEHGSWNRSQPVGYRVSRVVLNAAGAAEKHEAFVEGFLTKSGKVLGRPVDVLNQPDGSLLLSDDMNGVIYKISYDAKAAKN